jgi:single-strand DNA-binding protein
MIMSGLARIGRDAELKYTSSNMAVCNVALAFTIGFGDRKTTTWVEVAIWGKQAEGLSNHLLKGSAIVAHIKDIKLEEYKKRDGTNGAKLTATLVDMEFAGIKSEGASQEQPRQAPPQRQAPTPQKFEDFDDLDVPF